MYNTSLDYGKSKKKDSSLRILFVCNFGFQNILMPHYLKSDI